MATRRIVDLTAPQSQPKREESKDNRDDRKVPSAAETLNTMVMDTRGKINDAMQILFSRDSKLRKLHELTGTSSSAQKVGTKAVEPP